MAFMHGLCALSASVSALPALGGGPLQHLLLSLFLHLEGFCTIMVFDCNVVNLVFCFPIWSSPGLLVDVLVWEDGTSYDKVVEHPEV